MVICGYIDAFYETSLTKGIKGLAELTHFYFLLFFYGWVIDEITNGVGVTSFLLRESIKYAGGRRISSCLFFFFFIDFLYQSYY